MGAAGKLSSISLHSTAELLCSGCRVLRIMNSWTKDRSTDAFCREAHEPYLLRAQPKVDTALSQ